MITPIAPAVTAFCNFRNRRAPRWAAVPARSRPRAALRRRPHAPDPRGPNTDSGW